MCRLDGRPERGSPGRIQGLLERGSRNPCSSAFVPVQQLSTNHDRGRCAAKHMVEAMWRRR